MFGGCVIEVNFIAGLIWMFFQLNIMLKEVHVDKRCHLLLMSYLLPHAVCLCKGSSSEAMMVLFRICFISVHEVGKDRCTLEIIITSV